MSRLGERAWLLPAPGVVLGGYPQRDPQRQRRSARGSWQDHLLPGRTARRRAAFVRAVRACRAEWPAAGSADFARRLQALRQRMSRDGLAEPLLVEAFACLAEAVAATLRIELFDTQLVAARAMLDGRLVEMATGEGKTLAVFIAAAAAALAGVPVHAATANDYLVARDAAQFAPVCALLGLRAAAVTAGLDTGARRDAHAADIVYCTARELIFDYLRDRRCGVARHEALHDRLRAALPVPAAAPVATPGAAPILRGLCMAIVDEADAILIDEARTPFVLAERADDAEAVAAWREAARLAALLTEGDHFLLDAASRQAVLTEAGQLRLDAETSSAGVWRNQRFRGELIELALAARHLYARDVDYLVHEGRVHIVDAVTGRIADGRAWSRGLHQLIEIGEGLEPTPPQRTIAQLTFQRFFPRYLRLCGISGTLDGTAAEMRAVYGVSIERVAPRTPSRRLQRPVRVHAGAAQRWSAVIESVRAEHAAGRPVLVGTDSVAASERLGAMLAAAGLAHRVLNARHDAQEAELIAAAGAAGRITVTTNMAGRGTDIRPDAAALAAGGLHVLSCQCHGERRLDRQLYGRAARQGDPGSAQALLALDEGLLRALPRPLRAALRAAGGRDGVLPAALGTALVAAVQQLQAHRARAARARLMRSDLDMERRLEFGGLGE